MDEIQPAPMIPQEAMKGAMVVVVSVEEKI
jgi:hypothetical protein